MSNPLTDGCIKCPKCGQKRFDPICGSCERRQCGYVAPRTEKASEGEPK